MAAIRVNNETIRPSDLCIGDCDHERLIEYWATQEVEGLCEDKDAEQRILDILRTFGGAPEFAVLTFSAVLDGERRTITIEKI